MSSISRNGKAPPVARDLKSPPAGFVEVARYDLLVDAGNVIGPLADEMAVWFQTRPRWLRSGERPREFEEVRIWVPGAEAERARLLLAKLVPEPPTEEDFEREEDMSPPEPRGRSAVRRLLFTLLALGAFVAALASLDRCTR